MPDYRSENDFIHPGKLTWNPKWRWMKDDVPFQSGDC